MQQSPVVDIRRSRFTVKLSRVVRASWILVVLSLVMNGLLRWLTSNYVGAFFVYIDKYVMIATIILCLFHIKTSRQQYSVIILSIILFVFMFTGTLYSGNLAQHIFALWVYLPIIFAAMTFPFLGLDSRVRSAAIWLSFLVALGVFLNSFLELPWSGHIFEIGDHEIASARLWWATGDVERLSGFSRASFEAAAQLAVLALIYHALSRPRIAYELAYFFFIAYAIFLTTTKRVLFAYLACFLLIVVGRNIKLAVCAAFLRAGVLVAGLIGAIAPIFTVFVGRLAFSEDTVLRTLGARFSHTWPQALATVSEDWMAILGRGLGGVGTASLVYAPSEYILADSMFVHMFGIGGIVGGLLYVAFFSRIATILPDSEKRNVLLLGAASVFLFMTGIVANNLQSGTYGLLVGALYSAFFAPKSRLAHPHPIRDHRFQWS